MTSRPVKPRKVKAHDPFANDLKLPTLYKKTSIGAIQYWHISVIENSDHSTGYDIYTRYGQVDGKEQETFDSILEGKNIGKKNETTPKQQAEAEATAKWEKQKKKGYVDSIQAAQAGELDELITGGIEPMLAHKFSQQGHKIKYPCFTQPKLDGIRCIAIIENGVCTLWSRTRKPITSCPHIVQELEAAFGNKSTFLDGELYNHEMKKDFEKIVSLVRQEEPAEGHELVQYHVYDMACGMPFEARMEALNVFFEIYEFYSIKHVPTEVVNSEDDVMTFFDKFVEMGYEGAMLRNGASKYVNKRSYDLQKVKEFDDGEFRIVGIEEGRGKLAGHVGAFVCLTSDEKQFKAKAKGDTGKLADYFRDHSLWTNKRLTVQYQGLTGKEGVPRFPVGLRIRDDE